MRDDTTHCNTDGSQKQDAESKMTHESKYCRVPPDMKRPEMANPERQVQLESVCQDGGDSLGSDCWRYKDPLWSDGGVFKLGSCDGYTTGSTC